MDKDLYKSILFNTGKTKPIGWRVPIALLDEFKKQAKKSGIDPAEVIRTLMVLYVLDEILVEGTKNGSISFQVATEDSDENG